MSILRYQNVEWTLPLIGWADGYALSLIDAFRLLDEKIKLNVQGSFACPFATFGLKTTPINNHKNLEKLLAAYINLNTNLRIDFGNPLIAQNQKPNVKNETIDYLVNLGKDYQASFLITNDEIRNALKSFSQNIVCIASEFIAAKKFQNPNNSEPYDIDKEIALYNDLCKNYDIVILRPEFSKNYLLDNINKFDDISKLEIIINNSCYENCPQLIEHLIAKQQFYGNREKLFGNQFCYMEDEKISLNERLKYNNVHSIELIDKLVNAGIKRINLNGGINDIISNSSIASIFNYMIKDYDTAQMFFAQVEKGCTEIPIFNY